MMLNFFIAAFGFLVILIVYGLYTAKSWSYHPALLATVLPMILNILVSLLYASAPEEIATDELRAEVVSRFGYVLIGAFWAVVVVGYLTRPNVKQYLKQITPTSLPHISVPPPLPSIVTPEEKKFCRYCGAEQKSDAVFCEACGKKIG
jgi:hypothetical protein